MVRRALVLLVAVTAACGGDGDGAGGTVAETDASTTASQPTSVTSTAAPTTSTSTTTTVPDTTTAPPTTSPDPSLTAESGAIVAEVRNGEVTVRRADGRVDVAASGLCIRPALALTLDALVLGCEPELHLVSLADGGVTTLGPELPAGWTSPLNVGPTTGDRWVVVCVPSDDQPPRLGPCAVVSTDGGTVPGVDVPASLGLSGAGSLLRASSPDGGFVVIDVDSGEVALTVEAMSDRTSGRLVRLPDGSIALEAGFTTGGDSRPERLDLRDPRTDEPLGIVDGAELLPLTGLGLATQRPVVGVVVQPRDVVAQDPSGAVLWSIDDRDTVAVAAPPRLWLATPGGTTVDEVDPTTGDVVATIELPGPLADAVVPLRATESALVVRYEDGFDDVVAVISVSGDASG